MRLTAVKDNTISVIIPVLNEEKTIGEVVTFVKQHEPVAEIIVVDDKSIDDTVQKAKKMGASVITATKIGKGASMRDGFLVAGGGIILYLDGDIDNYSPGTIERMALPLIKDKADFVKATFGREAGRVTELVAKPLLSLLFPKLTKFSQPLSGIIAGRREFFQKIKFDDDYGVDIGILIDMHLLGARIAEVNIGTVQHRMKTWHQLSRMSHEVAGSILKRAGNLSLMSLGSLETINIIRDQMELAIKEALLKLKKMILFDMDTILEGRFIDKAAQSFGFQKELLDIITKNQKSFLLTKLIARLFKGLSIADLLAVVDSMPVIPHAAEVVEELKKRGYVVGLITDGFDCIANHVKNKIGADFALANELEFSESVATGEIKIPSFFMRTKKSSCSHNFCKSNALLRIAEQYKIESSSIIAVGDSEYDICMVKAAGIGVAFFSNSNFLNLFADEQIKTRSLKPILDFAM